MAIKDKLDVEHHRAEQSRLVFEIRTRMMEFAWKAERLLARIDEVVQDVGFADVDPEIKQVGAALRNDISDCHAAMRNTQQKVDFLEWSDAE